MKNLYKKLKSIFSEPVSAFEVRGDGKLTYTDEVLKDWDGNQVRGEVVGFFTPSFGQGEADVYPLVDKSRPVKQFSNFKRKPL